MSFSSVWDYTNQHGRKLHFRLKQHNWSKRGRSPFVKGDLQMRDMKKGTLLPALAGSTLFGGCLGGLGWR